MNLANRSVCHFSIFDLTVFDFKLSGSCPNHLRDAIHTIALYQLSGIRIFIRFKTYAGCGLGWKSGALGFNGLDVSLSGRGVDGFADVDLTPFVVVEPPSVFVVSESVLEDSGELILTKLKACGSTQSFSRLFRAPINDVAATFKSSRVSDLLNSPILVS